VCQPANAREPLHEPPPELVPKIIGADVEVANFILGSPYVSRTGPEASRLLLREIDGVPGSSYGGWFGAGGCKTSTAWGNSGSGRNSPDHTSATGYDSQDWGRKFLPGNGGCTYIDLSHLELCIPEVRSAHDYVAAWHAMLQIARQAQAAANRRLQPPRRLQVLVNNSDGQGNSYGGHLNFLVFRRLWDNIFCRRAHYMAYLASYQVTSIVFAGQGKVGSENGAPRAAYQLSQRADFFATITGLQTTYDRPIVNSRDEALCGFHPAGRRGDSPAERLARLHCIFYDSNLCHVANLLKAGMMQIFLAMLETERLCPALILEDPLDAVICFSHDPTLRARARTADGKHYTAVEWQLRFLDEAHRFLDQGHCEGVVPRAGEILALAADTLEKLHKRDYDALALRLDWVLKLQILRRAMAGRPGLTWGSPEIKHLDHLYSSLDPAEGLYWAYEKAGAVEQVVSPSHVERFMYEPPGDTRAYTRAMALRRAGARCISRVDWDTICFKLPGASGWPTYHYVNLPDPGGLTKEDTSHIFESARDLPEILGALASLDRAGTEAASGASIDAHEQGLLLPPPQADETANLLQGHGNVEGCSFRENKRGENHAIS